MYTGRYKKKWAKAVFLDEMLDCRRGRQCSGLVLFGKAPD